MEDNLFGKQLRRLRNSEKMTQVELAEQLNVSKGTVAMWETGKRETSYPMLVKIAELFDVSVDFLLAGKEIAEESLEEEPLKKSIKQKSQYDGFFDIMDLKGVRVKLHKFYDEQPGPEQRILTIGLAALEGNFISDICLSDVIAEETYLTGIDICFGSEVKMITKDEVLLYWIDIDEITDIILDHILEQNLNDLLYRTIIRFFENGGKLDE